MDWNQRKRSALCFLFPNPSLLMEGGKNNPHQTLFLQFTVQSHPSPDESNNKNKLSNNKYNRISIVKSSVLTIFKAVFFLNLNRLAAAAAKSLQSCPTLCDPIDSSPPGSPVPGILQARTLEWVSIAFSNGTGLLPLYDHWLWHKTMLIYKNSFQFISREREMGGYTGFHYKSCRIY